MKKINKIVAITLITSFIFTMGNVNAFTKMDVCNSTGGDFSGDYYDGICTKDGKASEVLTSSDKNQNIYSNTNTGTVKPLIDENKLNHKLKKGKYKLQMNRNPLLMTSEAKSVTKDKQLCKIGTSFDILNNDGTVKYTYFPKGCESEFEVPEYLEDINNTENLDSANNNSVDDFLGNIFGDNSSEDSEYSDTENNESENLEPNDFEDNNSSTESTDSNNTDSNDDLDEIFDLFGKADNNSNITLKGSKFVKTIRDFNKEKIKIRVGAVEANVLDNDMVYNENVANLLKQIDENFKIDSIKNSLAKNISNVSYSLSTYRNTTDEETKKVFKNKLVKDLQTLKKKYKILKNKDAMISATLEKRGQL